MAVIYSNSNNNSYGVKSFILDTDEDFKNFDYKGAKTGSTIFVIETSKHYMLNNKLEWKEIFPYGRGSSITDGDIIYDGGIVYGQEGNDEIIYDGGLI